MRKQRSSVVKKKFIEHGFPLQMLEDAYALSWTSEEVDELLLVLETSDDDCCFFDTVLYMDEILRAEGL